MEIVIASLNLHKIRELREMFKLHSGYDLLSLLNFPGYQSPEESGKTFKENATIKALHAAKKLQKPALGDDSGLVIPGLNGAPGIHSRYYAGEDATDAENRQKVLQEMSGLHGDRRLAYFECVLVLAMPDGKTKPFSAKCEGSITEEERGRNGFGYDALFIKNDYDKTFAELNEDVKNRISHRRKAFEKLCVHLESLLVH